MNDLTLHPMKEIRIIIEGEQLKYATDLLDHKATGYTVIHNISGKGHHGFHTAHPMFNEMDSIVMLMTVVAAWSKWRKNQSAWPFFQASSPMGRVGDTDSTSQGAVSAPLAAGSVAATSRRLASTLAIAAWW